MNKLIARIGAITIVLALGATTAHARLAPQPFVPPVPALSGPAQASFTQAAGADFITKHTEASVYAVNWTTSSLERGNQVCAWLTNKSLERTDAGCGSLTLTIDPMLHTGSVVGTIESELYDDSYNDLGPSQIDINVTWTGSSDPPIPQAFEFAEAYAVGAGAAAGTWIGHSATALGSIVSHGLCSGACAENSSIKSVRSTDAGLGEAVELDGWVDSTCLPPTC